MTKMFAVLSAVIVPVCSATTATWVQPAGTTNASHAGIVAATQAGVRQNKALARRWMEEGFNKKSLKVVDEIFDEDFAISGQRIGRAGLKRSMSRFFTAFPDLHVTINDLVAEGDKVALWYTVRGTHKGEFDGFRATGNRVSWSGSDLLRIARGKIVEGRFLDDLLTVLQQPAAPSAR
jgi:steroid delta-isomerase-like uncharacterized protein